MKKGGVLWIILCILVALNSGCAKGSLQFKPGTEPDGFRDIKWGTDVSILDGMVYVKHEVLPDNKIYTRKSDSLIIEGVKIDTVQYSFWKDKFYSVNALFKEYEDFIQLRKTLFNKFGRVRLYKGEQGSGSIVYHWIGDTSNMKLIYIKPLKLGAVRIESIAMNREVIDEALSHK